MKSVKKNKREFGKRINKRSQGKRGKRKGKKRWKMQSKEKNQINMKKVEGTKESENSFINLHIRRLWTVSQDCNRNK